MNFNHPHLCWYYLSLLYNWIVFKYFVYSSNLLFIMLLFEKITYFSWNVFPKPKTTYAMLYLGNLIKEKLLVQVIGNMQTNMEKTSLLNGKCRGGLKRFVRKTVNLKKTRCWCSLIQNQRIFWEKEYKLWFKDPKLLKNKMVNQF